MSLRPLSTLEVVQLLLGRFGARDAAGLAQLFAARVRWRVTSLPADPPAGAGRTRREVESFFLSFFGALAPEALAVRRLVVDGDDAVVLGRARCRVGTSPEVVSLDFVISVEVRDGLVRECWLMSDTLTAAIALGRARLVRPMA
ncbi:nuclear transport factor 2 family protein [Actinocrispum wychmicini]|uniref:Ketosteroid isomerase-like protein n=1 Tax=Actinocrispum wychmicini TaxID=1213861 RepID=A0A4R2IUC3_9PSEU|nr:nuclear transport factor 2 family protein [Actinocrispum wychmicini]TCO48006.1 ketosteroid isomerase-like protein [Actinocrispum wychmicini]